VLADYERKSSGRGELGEMAESGLLLAVRGKLHVFETEAERFELKLPECELRLEKDSVGFLLRVFKVPPAPKPRTRAAFAAGKEEPMEHPTLVLEQIVADDMRHQFFSKELSFVWVLPSFGSDAEPKCLSFRLEAAGDFVQLRNQFSVCLFESKMDFSKLNAGDQDWVRESERDDMDLSGDDDEEATSGESRYSKLGDERSGVRVGGENQESEEDDAQNSQLAVGYNNGRAFVVRGSRMGVFKSQQEGLDYQSLLRFKPQKGATFNPSQILLHQQDQSMLVLDPHDHKKVLRMDLERGSIVDEWGGLAQDVSTVARAEKYANLTPNPEFLGLNENALMRMDPRTKGLVVQSKAYAKGSRAKMDCMATTGAGYVAVASTNGDIRLYDQIGKNAKTHLPGLGVPIIGIDVTEDGTFVLATTKQFLLLIDTRVAGEAKGGFLKSMGKAKPPPLRLMLKPEDIVKHKIKDVSFTPAHFNTGSSLEKNIVTSTGPFVVVWNFRQVKAGRRNAYQIRRYRDNIVADEFEYNNEGKIIVTLPNDVTYNAMK